jgi:hypothetical protein
MTQVAWMAGSSVAAWLVSSVIARGSAQPVFYGMLGPLLVACASWVMAARVYKRAPQALTGLLIAAFAFKFVFFGAYVAVLLRVVEVPAVPFAVSFSSYFIALHLVEAVFLKRLFAGELRP